MAPTPLSTLFYLTFFFFLSSAFPFLRNDLVRREQLEIDHPATKLRPALAVDFPDPSVVQDHDGTWYAFATNGNGHRIQIAKADGRDPFGRWKLLDDVEPLPEKAWTSGSNTWAPDVSMLPNGSFIMYYSGAVPGSRQHCIGVARSETIEGPYEPDPEPWVCPESEGGAIDASGFYDEKQGKRYVVYKVDGNSKAGEGACGSGADDPTLRTPLMLQEVDVRDGATKKGEPVELLDRIASQDGSLIEAPELMRRQDGTYILFYSSHCFNDPKYDIKYAVSDDVEGPYRRADGALLQTPEFGLRGPGGVTTGRTRGDDFMAFHGYCEDKGRCFYTARYD